MNASIGYADSRKFAWLAMVLFLFSEGGFVLLSILLRNQPLTTINLVNAVATIFLRWIPALLIVFGLEKRGFESLGMVIKRPQYIPNAVLVCILLVVPSVFVGFNWPILIELIEQIAYIGLLEEFFYRGYLMSRFCNWLGNTKGWIWSSFLFGFGHIIARIADHGFGIYELALVTGGQAFLGGLIFGFIFLKANNIWPGSILHISTNMYLGRLMDLCGG